MHFLISSSTIDSSSINMKIKSYLAIFVLFVRFVPKSIKLWIATVLPSVSLIRPKMIAIFLFTLNSEHSSILSSTFSGSFWRDSNLQTPGTSLDSYLTRQAKFNQAEDSQTFLSTTALYFSMIWFLTQLNRI